MSFLKKKFIFLCFTLLINFSSIQSMEKNTDQIHRNQTNNFFTMIPNIHFLKKTHFPSNTFSPTIKKNIHTHIHTHSNRTHTHTHDHTYTPEGKLVRTHAHLYKGYFTKIPFYNISINFTKVPFYNTSINLTKLSSKFILNNNNIINLPNTKINDQSNSVISQLQISILSLFFNSIIIFICI
mgnify:CR=1 FL=1